MVSRNHFVYSLLTTLEAKSNKVAFTFLVDGEKQEQQVTYLALHEKASMIAEAIKQMGINKNERVLLFFEPGIDYVTAFLGCLYASVIAIPVYLPYNLESISKIQNILKNAQPILCLTTHTIRKKLKKFGVLSWFSEKLYLASFPSVILKNISTKAKQIASCHLDQLQWLTTDMLPINLAKNWVQPPIDSNQIAFLQYTSGSTGNPKGVMVSHSNLLQNLDAINVFNYFESEERIISWLPPYHDFGLIGGILLSLYNGWTGYLMSPLSFLQRPIRWMKAISRYQGTVSGAPNFAYEYCINKISEEDKIGLDLSSWKVAANSAEPIRISTIKRFNEKFSACGFKPYSIVPTYGLAESTLFVAGYQTRKKQELIYSTIPNQDAISLEEGLISCGTTFNGHQILIVNPDVCEICEENKIGEIWVKGPSIAQGYWNDTELTNEVFKAYLKNGNGPYLRTGDLGFIKNKELYIAGRLKDLIIIRGKNYYPQDIEMTTELSHSNLRLGCTCAFSIEHNKEEKLVIVQEVRANQNFLYEKICYSIRKNIINRHGIEPYSIILINSKTIPKTTSGKIQRSMCREQYQTNKLSVVFEYKNLCDIAKSAKKTHFIKNEVIDKISEVLHVNLRELPSNMTLSSIGMESLQAIEIKNILECTTGKMTSTHSLNHLTIAKLKKIHSLGQRKQLRLLSKKEPNNTIQTTSDEKIYPISITQEICLLSKPNIISIAYLIHNQIDYKLFKESIQEITKRHDSLRSIFIKVDDKFVRKVLPSIEFEIQHENITSDREDNYKTQIKSLLKKAANKIKDRKIAPLFSVLMAKIDNNKNIFIFAIDHLITDGFSIRILIEELVTLYYSKIAGFIPQLSTVKANYADFVEWQNKNILHINNEHFIDWKNKIKKIPKIEIVKQQYSDYENRGFIFKRHLLLNHKLTNLIKSVSHILGSDIYTILLTGFEAFIFLLLKEKHFLLRTNHTCRDKEEWQNIIGFFSSSIILRCEFSANLSFKEMVKKVAHNILETKQFSTIPYAYIQNDLIAEGVNTKQNWIPIQFNFLPFSLAPIEINKIKYELLEINMYRLGFALQFFCYFWQNTLKFTLMYRQSIKEEFINDFSLKHFSLFMQELLLNYDKPFNTLTSVIDKRESNIERIDEDRCLLNF